ncbi:MAG TPA: hypothetical protein VGB92_07370 [Longimicrobium sp.]|jgi:hypothetical protein
MTLFRMLTPKRERTVESIAQVAGGERQLERALQAFRDTYGSDPSGQELLAFVYDRRMEAEQKTEGRR